MALPQGGQFIDDFPANDTNYMEGLIKQHWESKKVEKSTLIDFPSVSSYVCSFNFKFVFLLTKSMQIFKQVISLYKKLDEHRNLWLSLVPNAWKNDGTMVLPKLKTLIINSQEWKKVINDIRNEVMPLWPDYETCYTDSTSVHPSSHSQSLGVTHPTSSSSSSFLHPASNSTPPHPPPSDYRPVTPPQNQIQAAIQSQSTSSSTPATHFDELNTEALSIFLPNHVTVSGLTSNEGSQILGAFLTLSETDRALVLALPQEDLALGFKRLINKKRRDVEHMESPEHKRIRHFLSPLTSTAHPTTQFSTRESGTENDDLNLESEEQDIY